MVDVIQYDAAVVREIVSQLETNLQWHVYDGNKALWLQGDTNLSLDTPADKSIEGREEPNLDSRILPQHNAGVWVRVVDSEDLDDGGPHIGVGRTLHTVEVHSWVNVQDSQPDSTTGSAASGYAQALYLARAVDDCIVAHLSEGCPSGITEIYRVPGNRIPTPLRKFPSVHVILTTYDVVQRTTQPAGPIP